MKERIKKVLANTFNIPISEIPDEAQINGLPNWDSLGHMMLMLELESEFGVSISTAEMTNLLSLDLIEGFLQSNGLIKGNEGSPDLD
jgi:acyl carrier protein